MVVQSIRNRLNMSENKEKKTKEAPILPIKYRQSSSYQVYFADGVMGGWTPISNLSIDFFVQRNTFPETVIHEITESGKLGKVIEQRGDKGITRERQFGLIINFQTAYELRDWLNKQIEEGEKAGLFKVEKK